MKSFITRGLSIYRNEGAISLFQRVLQKLQRDIYYKSITLRGRYSLTLAEQTVVFSAPTSTMVKRNEARFEFEKQALRDFIDEIEPNDVVFDIGANTGLYTIFGAKACHAGKVVAFEPYPPNLHLLKQDVARNDLENVMIFDTALSDSVGIIEFNQPDEDDVGYGSASIEAHESEATIGVQTTTGDQLVADGEIPAPDVVKIDVEGSEPLVIDGLKTALSEPNCRTIYCEVHLPTAGERPSVEDFGSSPEDIRNRLESFGFTVECLYDRGEEIFYKAQK